MKRKLSIVSNALIVIFELVSFIIMYVYTKKISIEFYTVDSNLLAFISSLLFLIFIFKKKKIPNILRIFKYITTINLTVTFLVVLFILGPMTNFNYGYLLFNKVLIFEHLLCPILSIVTFIFFDDLGSFIFKDTIKGISLTILYAIIIVTLNILKLIEGPYPFLKIYDQSILATLIWSVLILGLTYFISFILIKLYNKKNSN